MRGRSPTGKRLKLARGKRKREAGGNPANTRIGGRSVTRLRTMGGGLKLRLLSDEFVNVSIPSTGETKRVRILDFVDNPANRYMTRRKIIAKGTLLKTELGLVRVSSRPGQDGVLNAVLVEEKAS